MQRRRVERWCPERGCWLKAGATPQIDVWYGDTQRFGHVGNPQVWANILGNVSDSDGISSLTYSLNGGSQVALTVGPDSFRLQSAGDFNIDILRADLQGGTNQVVITATDSGNPPSQSQKIVTVEYTSNGQAPLPYSVDWDQMNQFDDAVSVVDGAWQIQRRDGSDHDSGLGSAHRLRRHVLERLRGDGAHICSTLSRRSVPPD